MEMNDEGRPGVIHYVPRQESCSEHNRLRRRGGAEKRVRVGGWVKSRGGAERQCGAMAASVWGCGTLWAIDTGCPGRIHIDANQILTTASRSDSRRRLRGSPTLASYRDVDAPTWDGQDRARMQACLARSRRSSPRPPLPLDGPRPGQSLEMAFAGLRRFGDGLGAIHDVMASVKANQQ